MGYLQQQAPQVGYSQSNAAKQPSSLFSDVAGLATNMFDNIGKKKAAEDEERAKAAGANLFYDQAIAQQELEDEINQQVSSAQSQADKDIAVEQGNKSRRLARAQFLLQQKELINSYGTSALDSYKSTSGKGGVEMYKDFYLTESEQIEKEQAAMTAKRKHLTDNFISSEGMSNEQINKLFNERLVTQKKLLDSHELTVYNTESAKFWQSDNAVGIQAAVSGPLNNVMAALQSAPQETRQQLLVQLENMSFSDVLVNVPEEAKAKLLRTDVWLDGSLSRQFNDTKAKYLTAAKEFMTKGTLTTATQNELSRLNSYDKIQSTEFLKEVFTPEGFKVWNASEQKSPELMNALDELAKLSIGRGRAVASTLQERGKAALAASNLLTEMKNSGVDIGLVKKEMVEDLMSAVYEGTTSPADVDTLVQSLSAISPAVLEGVSPRWKDAVGRAVDNQINTVKQDWASVIRQADMEPGSKLSNIYYPSIISTGPGGPKSKKLRLVVKPDQVPDEATRALLQGSKFTTKLEALINARSAMTGESPEQAAKAIIEEPIKEKEKPSEEKKDPLLGLSEDKIKFMKSLSEEDWQQLMQA